ncbi:GyrI-like domain-containing protein [Marinimicrobium sp. C6131]|uniref:GyrI-like domain-containing protein n=1 Tax=Marinimicrobium sp. C6131 TaxID=3022676 RepID=UPI00223D2969|nr:GyrI-like domain-containing protein [Marinimicrobium sp. C6131]UZJ43546.1 GyrI-like domain-containing protein [Marinimicrobium sp. C6131]
MTGMHSFKAPATAIPGLLGIESQPELRLVGLRRKIHGLPSTAIPGFWDRFSPYRGWIPGQADKHSYGVLLQAAETSDGFDYMTAVEVLGFEKMSADWDRLTVPAQRYAVFLHRDHVSELRPALHTIFAHSLPELNLSPQRRNGPLLLERYGAEFDFRTGWGGIQIWVPLQDDGART